MSYFSPVNLLACKYLYFMTDNWSQDDDKIRNMLKPLKVEVKQDVWHGLNRITREYASHKTLRLKDERAFKSDLKMVVRSQGDNGPTRTLPTAPKKEICEKLQALKSKYNLHPAVQDAIQRLSDIAGRGCLR